MRPELDLLGSVWPNLNSPHSGFLGDSAPAAVHLQRLSDGLERDFRIAGFEGVVPAFQATKTIGVNASTSSFAIGLPE